MKKFICVAALLVISAISISAQQKPDFTGTWKLNVAKSDFGPIPGPDSRTDVITHKEPAFTDEVTADGAQGKQQYTIKYTTDGKEVTNQIGPREVKSIVKWVGNTMVVTSKFDLEGSEVNAQAVWSLGADSKTMNVAVHYVSPMGEANQKLLLEKQEPAAPPSKTP